MRRVLEGTALLMLVLSASLLSQSRNRTGRVNDDCPGGWNDDRYRHCEVREATVPGGNPLDVDPGTNGGIRVRGWDRNDVHVVTRISAYADSAAEARQLAAGVRVEATSTAIRAEGPNGRSDEHWSASFEIDVPRSAMISLHTVNGGISIESFRGTAKFTARNGGIKLLDVGGDIRGETTNGGVSVDLSGDRWDGAGLDVETHNGGIKMTVPDGYSASLETGTVNGRVNVDFPMTVQGRISRQLTTTLGSGGPRIRVMTTNGGVSIQRR